jgi:hypothetical protein
MAKLRGPFRFTGPLGDLSAYTMEGSDEVILRGKTGPSAEQFKTAPSYAVPRRYASEFGGCGKASGLLMEAFAPLRPLPLHGTSGRLSALLKRVQVVERESVLGQRSIRLLHAPQLWAGLALSKGSLFDEVVRAPLSATLSRQDLAASVQIPALTPGANFFAQGSLPLFRLVVSLGVMPDLVYDDLRQGFAPAPGFGKVWPVGASTEWCPVKSSTTATTLELALVGSFATGAFSLVLCVAVHFGTLGPSGEVEPVKKWGRAKVLMVG